MAGVRASGRDRRVHQRSVLGVRTGAGLPGTWDHTRGALAGSLAYRGELKDGKAASGVQTAVELSGFHPLHCSSISKVLLVRTRMELELIDFQGVAWGLTFPEPYGRCLIRPDQFTPKPQACLSPSDR